MTHRLYKVTGFQLQHGHVLLVTFDDGSHQMIDFEPVLYGEMLGPLRDVDYFRQGSLDPVSHTLVWPNGADFDPETLHNWPEYKDELAARARSWAKHTE